jgi:fumarate reductase subunit D
VISRLSPYLWLAFSAGGTVAAFLLPVHVLLFGLAIPLGWIATPSFDAVSALVAHPLTRLYLFVLVSLSLFHWAHRFRYTLYDGLQLKHLEILIATFCYGTAVCGTLIAAWTLLTFAPTV